MKRTYTNTCLCFVFLIGLHHAQAQSLEIRDPDFEAVDFQLNDLVESFKNIHRYNESIRDPYEIQEIDSNGVKQYGDRIIGAWGNGYYQRSVGFRTYPFDHDSTIYYHHTPSFYDPSNLPAQEKWQETYLKWIGTGAAHQPLIRDVSRRIVGYSRMLIDQYDERKVEDQLLYTVVKNGVTYLLKEFEADGNKTFLFRRSQTSQKSFDAYVHSYGMLGLIEAYWLFKQHGFPDSVPESALIDVISKSAYSFVRFNQQFYQPLRKETWYNILIDENKKTNHKENINYRCHAIWALSEAYKITGNEDFRSLSISIFHKLKKYQRADGSWKTPAIDSLHDSHSHYHGIIITGLSSLYSISDSDVDLGQEIATCIVNSINHFIDYNDPGQLGRRIRGNGRITQYRKETPALVSMEAIMGLLMARSLVIENHPGINGKEYLDAILSRMMKIAFVSKYGPGRNQWRLQFSNPKSSGRYVKNTGFATLVYGLIHDYELNGFHNRYKKFQKKEELMLIDAQSKGFSQRLMHYRSGDTTNYQWNTADYEYPYKFITSGNFDGDKSDDLAVITYNPETEKYTQLRVFYGNNMVAIYNFNDGNEFAGLVAGDVNGDGLDDILLLNKTGGDNTVRFRVMEGKNIENELYKINSEVQFSANLQVVFGDFNGNGAEEFAVFDPSAPGISMHWFEWRYNPGKSPEMRSLIKSSNILKDKAFEYLDVATGDLNNDGIDELALLITYSDTVKQLYTFRADGQYLEILNDYDEKELLVDERSMTGLVMGDFYPNKPGKELILVESGGSFTGLYYYSAADTVITQLKRTELNIGFRRLEITSGDF
ncbi:MAG: FG-GAP-like repeat-containing protein [Cytophagales bacterium]|nr:FG-GAP-like repeat-containing protein [Cytophagales bacterium]